MKTLWIALMAVTFLLSIGMMVIVIYALGRMLVTYSRSVKLSKCDVGARKRIYPYMAS